MSIAFLVSDILYRIGHPGNNYTSYKIIGEDKGILVYYISLKKVPCRSYNSEEEKKHPSDSDFIHGLRLSHQLKTIVGPSLHGCLTHLSDYCAFHVYLQAPSRV